MGVRDEFFEFQEPTIGAAFLTQSVAVDTGTVKLEIWDTAGQERYRSLAPMYYRGAQGALVVFDITEPSTFDSAKEWIRELWSHTEEDRAQPLVFLVGNMLDKASQRQVNQQDVDAYIR